MDIECPRYMADIEHINSISVVWHFRWGNGPDEFLWLGIGFT